MSTANSNQRITMSTFAKSFAHRSVISQPVTDSGKPWSQLLKRHGPMLKLAGMACLAVGAAVLGAEVREMI